MQQRKIAQEIGRKTVATLGGTGGRSIMIDTTAMAAGGVAGLAVDVSMFPLDTIKTRMQSSHGFWKAGGVKGIYNGLASAAVGSVPGASLFFGVYETAKPLMAEALGPAAGASTVHMLAASTGELAACLVRVPTENVKQKMQAGLFQDTGSTLRSIISRQGYAGFYTGYASTVAREVPFSMIQFPLWEAAKAEIGRRRGDGTVRPWESAAAGSASGAFAAALTTPLDVVKTRLMLGADAKGVPYSGIVSTMRRVVADEGAGRLMSGVGPRVFWIGLGGFVFFFSYQSARDFLAPEEDEP